MTDVPTWRLATEPQLPSPYAVIPPPFRLTLRQRAWLRRVYAEGGDDAVRREVRFIATEWVRGRARTPREVDALREWRDDAVTTEVAHRVSLFRMEDEQAEAASRT